MPMNSKLKHHNGAKLKVATRASSLNHMRSVNEARAKTPIPALPSAEAVTTIGAVMLSAWSLRQRAA
jgi:hypothetical protein